MPDPAARFVYWKEPSIWLTWTRFEPLEKETKAFRAGVTPSGRKTFPSIEPVGAILTVAWLISFSYVMVPLVYPRSPLTGSFASRLYFPEGTPANRKAPSGPVVVV